MSTARFCQLFDMPERTWRRWQARARAGKQAKGPWPQPAREAATGLAVRHALAHPAWGHRKVWAMVRHDQHVVSQATVLRLLRDEGLLLPAAYQRERRQLAQRRKAAFAKDPTGPSQAPQGHTGLRPSRFETTAGGYLARWPEVAGTHRSSSEHACRLPRGEQARPRLAAVERAPAELRGARSSHPARLGARGATRRRLLRLVGTVSPTVGPSAVPPRRSVGYARKASPSPETDAQCRGKRSARTRLRPLSRAVLPDEIDGRAHPRERATDWPVELLEIRPREATP